MTLFWNEVIMQFDIVDLIITFVSFVVCFYFRMKLERKKNENTPDKSSG